MPQVNNGPDDTYINYDDAKAQNQKNSKKKKGKTIIKGQKNGCHFFSLRKGRMLP